MRDVNCVSGELGEAQSAATCVVGACIILFIGAVSAQSDTAVGLWRAQEGGTESLISLSVRDDRLYGRIIRKVDSQGRVLHETCADCPGASRGRPLEEIEFLFGLRKDGEMWVDGNVMDLRPGVTQGVVARADLRIEGDVAVLHAYLGIRALGQKRQWTRISDSESATPK